MTDAASYLARHWPSVETIPDGVDMFPQYPIHYPQHRNGANHEPLHLHRDRHTVGPNRPGDAVAAGSEVDEHVLG